MEGDRRQQRRYDDRDMEHRMTSVETRLTGMEAMQAKMDGKLDKLLGLASAGKGAWWLLMGLGSSVMALGGLAIAFGWHPKL